MEQEALIFNGTVINDGCSFPGYVHIRGERIVKTGKSEDGQVPGSLQVSPEAKRIDARGGYILPGVIDDQVHFRDPGMPQKGTIYSESRAAVAGGVTSFMDMPNTKPAAVTIDLLEQKFETAARDSVANYSFYLGATNDNFEQISKIDPERVCGLKVFMGSSTGNMLVDDKQMLARIFAESPVLVATHCEEEEIVKKNLQWYSERYGDQLTAAEHPLIRSEEACYVSTAKAVELAHKYGTRLHVLHLSTGRELTLFETGNLLDKNVTCEVCIHHLWFSDRDYAAKGNFIKWNPAVKTVSDREALREGVRNGKVDVLATDHAPHTLEEKLQPYLQAPSGGPLVQHSLVMMFEMVKQGVFTPEKAVEKMCHAPAQRFGVRERGYLREGYYADVVILHPDRSWTVNKENLLYKCGWSPLEGTTFHSSVSHTFVNGHLVWENGRLCDGPVGKALTFNR